MDALFGFQDSFHAHGTPLGDKEVTAGHPVPTKLTNKPAVIQRSGQVKVSSYPSKSVQVVDMIRSVSHVSLHRGQ